MNVETPESLPPPPIPSKSKLKVATVGIALVLVISAFAAGYYLGSSPSGNLPGPLTQLYVTGLVTLDSGSMASGASVVLRAEDGSAVATGTTGADGRFDIALNPQFPNRVLVKATYEKAGLPSASGFRWSTRQSDGGAVDVGRIVLPDPVGKELTLAGSVATSGDGSIRVSGVPAGIDSIWARGYVADDFPDVFPGDLAEGTTQPIVNQVVLWISALDSAGNPVTAVNPPANIRLLIPPSEWEELEDLVAGNGVLDTGVYSFNQTSGYWEREANGVLVNAAGSTIPESEGSAIRRGTHVGDVYAQFAAGHFSYWNIDHPATECDPDFGDAPDPPYPSLTASGGAVHLKPCSAWLGHFADGESDAEVPDLDLYDDGLESSSPLKVKVANWDWPDPLYINVLIDQGRDGDWSDAGDWIVRNVEVSVPEVSEVTFNLDAEWDGISWMRITLTGSTIANYDGHGSFAIGETEDYGPPMDLLEVTVWGNGTVSSTPSGIDCREGSGTCSWSFERGTKVDLAASPDPGESFIGWEGACGGVPPDSGVCTLDILGPTSVGALFSQPFVDLSVYIWGNGGITSAPPGVSCAGTGIMDYTIPPACVTRFPFGTGSVVLTATPDPSETFYGWSSECSSSWTNATCGVVMDRDRTVDAFFANVTMGLTVDGWNQSGFGNVTSWPPGINCSVPGPSCLWHFLFRAVVTLTATPGSGYSFDFWTGDCSGTSPICTVRMNQPRWVFARFV